MHLTLMQQELEGSKSEDKRRSKGKNQPISKDQILEGKNNLIQAKQVHKRGNGAYLAQLNFGKNFGKIFGKIFGKNFGKNFGKSENDLFFGK